MRMKNKHNQNTGYCMLRPRVSSTEDRPSKEKQKNPSICVPMPLPTVTIDTCMPVAMALDKHPTVVADVHADVPQTASDSAAVAERS